MYHISFKKETEKEIFVMYSGYRIFKEEKGKSHPSIYVDGPMKGDKYLNAGYAAFTKTAHQQLIGFLKALSCLHLYYSVIF